MKVIRDLAPKSLRSRTRIEWCTSTYQGYIESRSRPRTLTQIGPMICGISPTRKRSPSFAAFAPHWRSRNRQNIHFDLLPRCATRPNILPSALTPDEASDHTMPPKTMLLSLNSSPKRKRDPPPAPALNTSTPPRPHVAGENSPRSVVADQLRDLKIKPPISILDFATLAENSMDLEARKKQKRSDSLPLRGFNDIPIRGGQGSGTGKDTIIVDTKRDIPGDAETSRPLPITNAVLKVPAEESLEGPSHPPGPEIVRHVSDAASVNSHLQLRKKSPSPPPSSLTWQDSEITGHSVDPSQDPDDDGTGLNGIGFKPTPALAYARAQRRRQQVLEWKAREAKEARQKRSERRRRGAGGIGPETEDVKDRMGRIVRFAT